MSLSFQSCLWEGTALIYDRYSEGKAFSKDVVSILTARVAAEERYAKELSAIAAKVNGLTDVQASLPAAWVSVRDSHAARAEAHSIAAKKLQSEIVKVLSDDIRDRSVKKGELFEEDKSLHAQLSKHKSATESALQRFLTASAAAEASRKQFHFAQQDASIPPKKLKVLEAQEAKLSGEADKAHEAYKQTLAELNSYQKTYEESSVVMLNKLQEMDESRGALMANVLRVYMDTHLALVKSTTLINDISNVAVANINAVADLQAWIQENKNGLATEPLVEYEGYEPQFENAGADEVPHPSKVSKVFSKSSLRRGTGGGAATLPAKDDKKLARQKSLSRLLGNKSKPVSKKGDPSPSPTSASGTSPGRKGSIGDGINNSGNKLSQSSPVISGPVRTDNVATPKAAAAISVPSTSASVAATSAAKTTAKGGRRAKALFEFIASDDTEISFAIGDIVAVVRVDDSGWWDCDKDGELGLAPGNYLQFLEEETKAAPAPAPAPAQVAAPASSPRGATTKTAAVAAPVADPEEERSPVVTKKGPAKAAAAPEPEPEPEAQVEDATGEEEESDPIGWATALYDFAGDGDDELPVKTGDRVEVYAEIEGWYSASGKDGRYGLCPKNFFSDLKPL